MKSYKLLSQHVSRFISLYHDVRPDIELVVEYHRRVDDDGKMRSRLTAIKYKEKYDKSKFCRKHLNWSNKPPTFLRVLDKMGGYS